MTKKILLTGGCGFIGHHFVEHILKNTDWNIVILDRLSYASSGLDRIRDIQAYDDKRVLTLTADFNHPIEEGLKQEIGDVNHIIHMGAESHVDNSIKDPKPFVMSNVVGTMEVLNFARSLENLESFVYFSTDEVYGPAPPGINYSETDRINCTNPYSATKAGAEQLAKAYANCYNLPIMITNTMNVFGERQHPEKFIPGTINKVLKGEKVIIHGNKDKSAAGSRFYIHARNVAAAVMFLLEKVDFKQSKYYDDDKGMPQYRFRYNIVGDEEVDNLTLAKMIAETVGKELNHEIVDFHSSRPGHDLRYALSGDKLMNMGYHFPKSFKESLQKTVKWTLMEENKKWLGS